MKSSECVKNYQYRILCCIPNSSNLRQSDEPVPNINCRVIEMLLQEGLYKNSHLIYVDLSKEIPFLLLFEKLTCYKSSNIFQNLLIDLNYEF